MAIYVALVRGINVGGRTKVRMAELRELMESLGHGSVVTYLQSGNVVFSSTARGTAKLGAGIERAISESLDLDVAVLIRSASQLARVVEENPFMKRACDPAHLHVTFLVDSPDRPAVTRIDAGRYVPDEFAVAGQHVYLHCPNGYGRTKLNNTFFERRLATAATTRNWRTVTALAELSAG